MTAYDAYYSGKLEDYELEQRKIEEAEAMIPKVG